MTPNITNIKEPHAAVRGGARRYLGDFNTILSGDWR